MPGRGAEDDEAGRSCRLYLLTPPTLDPEGFAPLLAAALDAGDVGAVQLRLKRADDAAILRAVDRLRPVAQERGVAFLLNDRPDLAGRSGCDGAHVGPDDPDVTAARRLLGDGQLGVSCYRSRDAAMVAGEQGADYVAFGNFFASPTKPSEERADPELLRWWTDITELPAVAIGGITAENCAPLVRAGADFLAVVSAVWDHPEGEAAGVRALARAISEA